MTTNDGPDFDYPQFFADLQEKISEEEGLEFLPNGLASSPEFIDSVLSLMPGDDDPTFDEWRDSCNKWAAKWGLNERQLKNVIAALEYSIAAIEFADLFGIGEEGWRTMLSVDDEGSIRPQFTFTPGQVLNLVGSVSKTLRFAADIATSRSLSAELANAAANDSEPEAL